MAIRQRQKMKCNNCGKEIPGDSEFCQYCGSNNITKKEASVKLIMICGNCGKELPEDSEFCQYCGSKLRIESDQKKRITIKRNNKKQNRERMIILAVFVLMALLISVFGISYFREKNLAPIPVKNGRIISFNELNGANDYPNSFNYVHFVNETDRLAVVYIRDRENKEAFCCLTLDPKGYSWITIPNGEFEVFYALGDNWYGKSLLFGRETKYYRYDKNIKINSPYDQHYHSYGEDIIINEEKSNRILKFLFPSIK